MELVIILLNISALILKSWRNLGELDEFKRKRANGFFYTFFKGSGEETPANDKSFQSNIDIWEDSRPNLQELYL